MGRTYENRKADMAKTAGRKTSLYSKFGKEIYVCAKGGGIDPSSNLGLRRLIEKAKKNQIPAHIIEKAIDKAKGGGGEDYSVVRYEGFGPGNCLVLVDCLTDNNNRTIGDIRTCFNKAKAKLGAPGAVAHLFDHRAVFSFQHTDEDAVLEALMEQDVDVSEIESGGGIITVLAPTHEYNKVKTALTEAFGEINFEIEEITFIPQSHVEIKGEEAQMLEKLLDLLNDCDDVQEVYHNADMSQQ